MTAPFLSRFFVYAVSAILVSVLALFVLSLNEKRLKSKAAFLLATLLLIRIFIPMGVFGVSLITLGEKPQEEAPSFEIQPPSVPEHTPSDTPTDPVTPILPPSEPPTVRVPFWENELDNCTALTRVYLPKSLTAMKVSTTATPVFSGSSITCYTELESVLPEWRFYFGNVIPNTTYEDFLIK